MLTGFVVQCTLYTPCKMHNTDVVQVQDSIIMSEFVRNNTEFLAKDTFSLLNTVESDCLDSVFAFQRSDFSFKGKRVLFLKGSSGGVVCSKKDYWMNKDDFKHKLIAKPISQQMLVLPDDLSKLTGYDVVIAIGMKIRLTDKHVMKILKK